MEPNDVDEVIGSDAYGPDGQKIGRVGQVYLDDETGQPNWVTVNTGLLGTSDSFVPLAGSSFDGDRLTLAHSKSRIADAPDVGGEDHLTPEQEADLYEYYGLVYDDQAIEGRHLASDADVPAATMPADDAMTVSREELQVGTTSRVSGRARMRKYVVVEEVQVTVPVRREKVVLETDGPDTTDVGVQQPSGEARSTISPSGEPASDTSGGTPASPLSAASADADPGEMILYEERPVVTTETVAVQRVRLGTEEQLVEETITEDVREEHAVLETTDVTDTNDSASETAETRDRGTGTGPTTA